MASTLPEGGADQGFPDDPFWDFSLATYDRPGVAAACLGLQDRHGIDVNMVLFCCWAGASGAGMVDPAAMAAALNAALPWQRDVVVPLRRIRRDLKGAGQTGARLRRHVASAEIDAEHAEQLMISATWAPRPDAARDEVRRIGDACVNLRCYFDALDLTPGEADRADLAALLGGVFPLHGRWDMDATVEKEFYGAA